jgi:hypothetical protein
MDDYNCTTWNIARDLFVQKPTVVRTPCQQNLQGRPFKESPHFRKQKPPYHHHPESTDSCRGEKMRIRSTSLWLLLVGPNVHGCLAANSRSSAVLPRQSSVERLESIPRGGGIGGVAGIAVSLDPKTVATAGLSCLAAHCAFDIVAPSKSVEFYGLDKYEKINAFYVSRIGGWGLAVIGSLLLQLYTSIPFIKAIGYSFLPITTLTIIQLLSGTYEQVSFFDMVLAS